MVRILVASLMLIPCALLVAQGGPAKKDLDLLQGKWSVTFYEVAGEKVEPEKLKSMEVLVRDEQMTIRDDNKIVLEFKVKIDQSKKPKAIDLTHLSGEHKGQTELGIYVLEGDSVRFCIDDDGKVRPSEFKTSDKLPFSLVVFKKKADPKK